MIERELWPAGDEERPIEPILYAAANYEPDSAMPPGTEERALSRVSKRGPSMVARRMILAAGGVGLAAIFARIVGLGIPPDSGAARPRSMAKAVTKAYGHRIV